jgi:hypothetical protein
MKRAGNLSPFSLLVGLAFSLAITSCTCERPRPVSPSDSAACRAAAAARAVAAAGQKQPASAVRHQLELEVARCTDPQAGAKNVEKVAQANSDLADAARLYLAGKLDDRGYRQAIDARLEELCRAKGRPDDPACHRTEGPDRQPTPPPGVEPVSLSQLLDGVSLLFDPTCDSSPPPLLSEPLAWSFGPVELSMTKASAGQAPACELLYQVELRLSEPFFLHGLPGQPPPVQPPAVVHRGVLFRAREDIAAADPRRAVFLLPGPTPTAERTRLAVELQTYGQVQWRVRALNGAQKTSGWSALRTQVNPFVE